MNGLDDVPDVAYRAIFLGIVFYFALVVYELATGDVLAALAAEFVFGVIAIGVGTVLALQTDSETRPPAVLGAVGCLLLGGMLQFGFVLTRIPSINQLSSLAVFAGIGLYIYTVWDLE